MLYISIQNYKSNSSLILEKSQHYKPVCRPVQFISFPSQQTYLCRAEGGAGVSASATWLNLETLRLLGSPCSPPHAPNMAVNLTELSLQQLEGLKTQFDQVIGF